MKIFLWMVAVALLAGCEADQETKDFFYSGWVNPEEGANMRMYGTKKAPEDYGSHATTPTDDLSRLSNPGN